MTESQTPLAHSDDGYEIDILRMVRRRWPLIAFGLLISMSAAIAYQLNATPMYESSMVILVAQRSSELTTSGVSSSSGMNSTLQYDLLATHTELLRSPRILNEAIEFGELEKLDSFQVARRDGIPAMSYLADSVSVEAGGEGDAEYASVLKVSYENPIPEDATRVLEAVYNRYRNYVESQIGNSGEEAAALINQAQAINETELKKATEAYQKFVANSAGLLDGEELKSVPHERLKAIENELTEIRSSLAYARSRLELIDDMSKSDKAQELTDIDRLALLSSKELDRLQLFMDVSRGEVNSQQFQLDQPLRAAAVSTEHDELLSLILREKALTADFGDDHPLVERVRNDIASVKQFIREKNSGCPLGYRAEENVGQSDVGSLFCLADK